MILTIVMSYYKHVTYFHYRSIIMGEEALTIKIFHKVLQQ